MKNKLTEWLDGKQKPLLHGVYQRDYKDAMYADDREQGIVFSYWDGHQWGIFDHTKDGAVKCRFDTSSYQSLWWRGLSENPEK